MNNSHERNNGALLKKSKKNIRRKAECQENWIMPNADVNVGENENHENFKQDYFLRND